MKIKNKDTVIYCPSEIALRSKVISDSFFLGWETQKNEVFIISAYDRENERQIRSALSKLNGEIKSKNGHQADIELVKEINLTTGLKKYLYDCNVSSRKKDDGTEGVAMFTYNYLSFLPIIGNPTDSLGINLNCSNYISSDSKSELLRKLALSASVRAYMDILLSEIDKQTNGDSRTRVNLYSLIHKILFLFTCYFKEFAIMISKAVSWISLYLKCLNCDISPVISYSSFLTSLSNRLNDISGWKTALEKLEIEPNTNNYLSMRNKVCNHIARFYLDLMTGIFTFIFFRNIALEVLFKLRSSLKAYYFRTLKLLFYFTTKRIGIYCKLNNEIGMSLSKFLVNKINLWYLIRPKAKLIVAFLLKTLQYSSILGTSMQFSLFVDIFLIETLHLIYIYVIILSIMNYTQKYLYSLLYLFKRKKWNVLKNTLDTNNFTKEELFIGIVIFTVFALNYPTIWIFYVSIILIVLPILVTKVLMIVITDIIEKIPVYSLLCNILFPNIIKESIYFEHSVAGKDNENVIASQVLLIYNYI
ncbi:N-acetylglucosamine transferase, putative [Theileria equi strain WA]|uniref:N-acetylglucosamine transferase, putative n=1 Tax=Theileria equi strain WA TaxID=1537102 RepID=L0B1L0_THEEQ|nr:N-acetylglucosamine transferase, putative [Theileria equi strain WA]AFZ81720.1 N-acetylglucosamine transferase, putative [Theileria equi strain WA]|eukprot:XP_004831386.1 N-acetylglucosamine transferase, putative [Theileria equi strain WA]